MVDKVLLLLAVFSLSTPAYAADGVILLHGLCRSHSSMVKMESALTEAGFIVENVDYPSRTAGIAQLSDDAIGKALENPKLKECTKIHFVTHSLGGIMVRSYFKRHHFERLGRVVMLGPPNQGSEVVDTLESWPAFQKLNGPAGGELGTGSDSTPNTLGPVAFELGVIAGDRSINWINSTMLAGKDDGKVSVERTKVVGMKEHLVVHATHPFLMKNNVVIENTIRFLRTGSFKVSS
jgi:triacylglycerol lipase